MDSFLSSPPHLIQLEASFIWYFTNSWRSDERRRKYEGNSFEAIQEALSSYVEGIEVDVRISKDGIPFIFHGINLEEATNYQGITEENSWEELKKITYKSAPHSKLMSLEELFAIVGNQKYLFLDIKSARINISTGRQF